MHRHVRPLLAQRHAAAVCLVLSCWMVELTSGWKEGVQAGQNAAEASQDFDDNVYMYGYGRGGEIQGVIQEDDIEQTDRPSPIIIKPLEAALPLFKGEDLQFMLPPLRPSPSKSKHPSRTSIPSWPSALPSLPSVQKRWHSTKWRPGTMKKVRRWHKKRNNSNSNINKKKVFLLRRRHSLGAKKATLVYGRKRKRMGLLAQMGITMGEGEPMTEQKLAKISAALAMWEAKLMRFAAKFSETPEVLEENSTWNRLLRVRDSLRQLLLKAEMQALDQTRM